MRRIATCFVTRRSVLSVELAIQLVGTAFVWHVFSRLFGWWKDSLRSAARCAAWHQQGRLHPRPKHIRQFDCICDKLLGCEPVADVFAIGLTSTSAIPLDYDKFLFQLPLKGVSQIHGGHSGTTMQEEQNWQRSIVSTNENVLIHIADVDSLKRRDTVGFPNRGSASGSEPPIGRKGGAR